MSPNTKYTLSYLNKVLEQRGLSNYLHATFLSYEEEKVTIKDKEYGEYFVDLKAFCDSMPMPRHKNRRHFDRMQKFKEENIGKWVNDKIQVVNTFYGPDEGYKNRSFYIEYRGECGHTGVSTKAHILNHRKTFKCQSCAHTDHGIRTKENGILKKRTPTYNYWVANKSKFPEQYHKFSEFRRLLGDKPARKAEVKMVEGKFTWVDFSDTEEMELSIISSALRQAFRRSKFYKEALTKAKVESTTTTKYRCAHCKELFILADIQVDHVDPVSPLDGSDLTKYQLLDRIWTDRLQVLDTKCHLKKTQSENKIRKANKEKL